MTYCLLQYYQNEIILNLSPFFVLILELIQPFHMRTITLIILNISGNTHISDLIHFSGMRTPWFLVYNTVDS